jgi:ferredoxin-NADP reductase
LTVAEVDALLYLPGHSRALLGRAVEVPALSPGWRASFQEMLAAEGAGLTGNAGLGPVAPPPAWPGFRPLRVTAIEPESSTVSSFRLADPDGAALPAAAAGQYLTLRIPAPGGPALLRSYSLSGPPGASEYRISVQREPHGAGSTLLHATVHAGALLDVAAPRGAFLLRPSTGPVLLVSAGVGATPLLAMLHALVDARSAREVWWLHTARDGARHAFRVETDALLARLPHAHRHVRYTHPRPADRDHDATGRPSPQAPATLGLPTDADAYLCGPAAFLADLTATLTGLGLAPRRIHTEVFGAVPGSAPGIVGSRPGRPQPPPGAPGPGPAVTFVRSDLTVNWGPATRACSSWPRPARYPRGGAAAPGCARPAGPACWRGRCPTCRTPSSRRPTAKSSCAARSPPPNWSSTSDGPVVCWCPCPPLHRGVRTWSDARPNAPSSRRPWALRSRATGGRRWFWARRGWASPS